MIEMTVTTESKRTRDMDEVPTGMKQRTPSSRVLEQVIGQAPVDYFTVGWLTSTLQQRSFGFIMLFLGLLAATPRRLHVARPYAGRDGSAVAWWPERTCFPGFHQDPSLTN